MNFYLYTETAFHHEGDKNYLLKLIDETKKSGAKGIKFQVLIELNEFMSSLHSSYEEAKNWILSMDEWREVFAYANKLNLDIVLMPLDIKAFDFVDEFAIKYIEIHSVSFNDTKLLEKLEEIDIPLIFGIGGRTLLEIDNVITKYSQKEIVLMIGFQSFPSDLNDIKLERIKKLQVLYPKCIIGYADHSSYNDEMAITSNEYAYVLGARIFEKHITADEGIDRIDYQSAVSSEKIKTIIKKVSYLESILNLNPSDVFDMSDKEIVYRNRQKVPTATRKILTGENISEDMISFKMINNDNAISSHDEVIGKKTLNDIEIDEIFKYEDII